MSIAPIPRITDDQLAGLADRHGIPTEAMQVIRHIACLYSGGAIEGDPTQLFTTGHYVWLARRALEQMVALSQQPVPAAVQALAGQHPDDAAVDRFAAAMKVKLSAARAKGRGGWDDPAQCCVESLAVLLVSHLDKGNAGTFEDIANFAMMLHQRGADPRVLADVVAPAPAAQDPIGWWDSLGTQPIRWADGILRGSFPDGTPIYTAPPAAEQPRMWMAKDERAIRELLAAINRDGGQHQHNVGIAQAARDALEEFDRIRQELAEQPESARSILTDDDMRRLRRFQEICEDSDASGHDLPKEAVKRLERAGALRSCGFGRHEVTLFGDYLLGKEGEA